MSGQRVSVDADALRQVLLALMGPGHLIRELQATISISELTGNPHPIKVLLKDFHDATNSPSQGPVADRSDAVQQQAPAQAVPGADAQPADASKEPAGTAAGVEAAAVGDAVRPGAAVLTQRQPDWWRKRADEIEAAVARSGSTDAMRCYTDMRTLLQAATTPFPVKQEAPAQAVQAVPDGWKPVPVEPTDKMVQATHHLDLSYMPDQWGADRAAIYRAMLAAAPAAPQPAKECWCESCDLAQGNPLGRTRMSLCPQCGDKRCPRAKHHDNVCAQQERKPMVDAAAEAFNNTFHKVRAEVSMDWWQRIWAKGAEWALRDARSMTAAASNVLAERQRQISVEGWTPEHDAEHNSGELAIAAACYATCGDGSTPAEPSPMWPWDSSWWRPSDNRRNLVKAGALILAEIERLDRAAATGVKHLPSDDTEGGCIG